MCDTMPRHVSCRAVPWRAVAWRHASFTPLPACGMQAAAVELSDQCAGETRRLEAETEENAKLVIAKAQAVKDTTLALAKALR